MNYALVTCSGCGYNFKEWDFKKASGFCSEPCRKIAIARRKAAIGRAKKRKKRKFDFYDSDAWRVVRYQAIRRAQGACEACGARASLGNPLHVDHIKPRALYPELAIAVTNLQVLCRDCNIGKGYWDQTDWRKA